MRMIQGWLVAAAASMLMMTAACGDRVDRITSPGGAAPPTSPAAQPTDVAGITMVQATQKLIVANEAYQVLTLSVSSAIDAGVITPAMAKTLGELNSNAREQLGLASRATIGATRFYHAQRVLDLKDAIERILGGAS